MRFLAILHAVVFHPEVRKLVNPMKTCAVTHANVPYEEEEMGGREGSEKINNPWAFFYDGYKKTKTINS